MKNYKQKLSSNRAITLIALIITIIIMLILVGVSISLVIQSDLIGVAEDAGDKTTTKYQEEAGLSEVAIGDKTYNSIEEYIAAQGGQAPGEGTGSGSGDEGGDGDGDGNGTILPADAGKKYNQNGEYSDGTNTAMIPAKFTVSGAPTECTISEGLVIYLIDNKTDAEIEAIDWTDAATLETLQKSYDQFVWIPIQRTTDDNKQDINDMYICQNKGTGSYGTAACVITVPEATGVATCSTHGNCTAMAGRLYATTIGESFEQYYTERYTPGSGLREPDVIESTNYDGNTTNLGNLNKILGTSYTTSSSLKADLQTEYNAVVKSVYENQGFYVGRYETTGIAQSDGTPATIRAGTAKFGIVDWYFMYAQQKDYAANHSLTVRSTMIQGAAYDQVMEFVNTGDYNVKQSGEIEHKFSGAYKTGSQSADASKNIYDLEGNVRAWTTEAQDNLYRIVRGGRYNNSSSASYRNSIKPSSKYDTGNYVISSICQLYI